MHNILITNTGCPYGGDGFKSIIFREKGPRCEIRDLWFTVTAAIYIFMLRVYKIKTFRKAVRKVSVYLNCQTHSSSLLVCGIRGAGIILRVGVIVGASATQPGRPSFAGAPAGVDSRIHLYFRDRRLAGWC